MGFSPSHFPFTEPSAEVDIGYEIKDGKIIIGEGESMARDFRMWNGSS